MSSRKYLRTTLVLSTNNALAGRVAPFFNTYCTSFTYLLLITPLPFLWNIYLRPHKKAK